MVFTHQSIFQWRYFETLNLQFTRISPNRPGHISNFRFLFSQVCDTTRRTWVKKNCCVIYFLLVRERCRSNDRLSEVWVPLIPRVSRLTPPRRWKTLGSRFPVSSFWFLIMNCSSHGLSSYHPLEMRDPGSRLPVSSLLIPHYEG